MTIAARGFSNSAWQNEEWLIIGMINRSMRYFFIQIFLAIIIGG
jgi:hypothetical protein